METRFGSGVDFSESLTGRAVYAESDRSPRRGRGSVTTVGSCKRLSACPVTHHLFSFDGPLPLHPRTSRRPVWDVSGPGPSYPGRRGHR